MEDCHEVELDPRHFWVGRVSVAHHETGGVWVVDRVERFAWPAKRRRA